MRGQIITYIRSTSQSYLKQEIYNYLNFIIISYSVPLIFVFLSQTWDLLRIVVYGFLAFCEWFFTNVSPDGKYFISPLRINGSALESIFSVLKHTSGGNLSALNYGPSLGRFIYRKGQVVVNQNSETGYRDITLNLDGEFFDTSGHLITVKGNRISNDMCQFKFPVEISQSTIGGRQGSNACTLIAVLFGVYCFKENLDISLLWEELAQIWLTHLLMQFVKGIHCMMSYMLTLQCI